MRTPLDPGMRGPVCPSGLSPIRVGGKRAGMVIRCLEHGPRRFSELRVPLPGVTAKTLTRSCVRWSAPTWSSGSPASTP